MRIKVKTTEEIEKGVTIFRQEKNSEFYTPFVPSLTTCIQNLVLADETIYHINKNWQWLVVKPLVTVI